MLSTLVSGSGGVDGDLAGAIVNGGGVGDFGDLGDGTVAEGGTGAGSASGFVGTGGDPIASSSDSFPFSLAKDSGNVVREDRAFCFRRASPILDEG